MSACLQCGQSIRSKIGIYCSNQCQMDHKYAVYIEKWQRGKVDGNRGIKAKNISGHIRRYMRLKYGNSCSVCGWSKVNVLTGMVPLEIDHIDGDSENNTENNLRLICPNCHSLTSGFRNLNRGRGRSWRKEKYIKST